MSTMFDIDDEVADIASRASGAGTRRVVTAPQSLPPSRVRARDDDEDEEEEDDEEEKVQDIDTEEAPKPRRAPRAREPKETASSEVLDAILPPQKVMKVVEKEKSLGDLMSKYNIGQTTEYCLYLYRNWPKIFPGGIKADGYYDTWQQVLTEEFLMSEYGGGVYRIVVMGPTPDKPQVLKHYDSITISLAGDPNSNRQPRAIQNGAAAVAARESAAAASIPQMHYPAAENPKSTEVAMKMATELAKDERQERIRSEERASKMAEIATANMRPLIDMERQRADDLVKAEKERSELERRYLQEQLSVQATEMKIIRERQEEMDRQRESPSETIKNIFALMQGSGDKGESGKSAERMLESVLSKHQTDLEAARAQTQQLLETQSKQHDNLVNSMRQSHAQELSSMRESHQRELAADRTEAKRREERIEDLLKNEREERRRDQERHRELNEASDRAWKDRLEMQLSTTNQNWESRHQTVVASMENRAGWLQQEIDRLRSESSDMKTRMVDNSDPIALLHKTNELRDAFGVPSNSGGSSGGGISPPTGDDWKTQLAEGVTDRLPQLMQVIGAMLTPQQQAPQQAPQYTVGQIVNTPNGEMVVVKTPQGGLGLVPRAAMQAPPQGRMLPPRRQSVVAPRRQGIPDADDLAQTPRRKTVSATQNFAEPSQYGSDPLPTRRRPPWEGGGEEEPRRPERRPERRQEPTIFDQPPAPPPEPPARVARTMTSQERQGLTLLSTLVHKAVSNADEPEEFAEAVLRDWPAATLRQVVSVYKPEDIARGIMETAPNSAGATPAGQKFVLEAFARISTGLQND